MTAVTRFFFNQGQKRLIHSGQSHSQHLRRSVRRSLLFVKLGLRPSFPHTPSCHIS